MRNRFQAVPNEELFKKKGYELTGEYREIRAGEHYVSYNGCLALKARSSLVELGSGGKTKIRWILRKLPAATDEPTVSITVAGIQSSNRTATEHGTKLVREQGYVLAEPNPRPLKKGDTYLGIGETVIYPSSDQDYPYEYRFVLKQAESVNPYRHLDSPWACQAKALIQGRSSEQELARVISAFGTHADAVRQLCLALGWLKPKSLLDSAIVVETQKNVKIFGLYYVAVRVLNGTALRDGHTAVSSNRVKFSRIDTAPAVWLKLGARAFLDFRGKDNEWVILSYPDMDLLIEALDEINSSEQKQTVDEALKGLGCQEAGARKCLTELGFIK